MLVGTFQHCVKSSCKHVKLDLMVPLICNELLKPLGKPSEIGSRKAGNNGFEFFNAHDQKIRSIPCCEKQRFALSIAV